MADAVLDPHVLPLPAIDVEESSLESGDHTITDPRPVVQELLLAPSRAPQRLFDLRFVQFGLGLGQTAEVVGKHPCLNRTGNGGGSIAWKGRWSHGNQTRLRSGTRPRSMSGRSGWST